jgi:chemotaxis protein methyltransferase CheR
VQPDQKLAFFARYIEDELGIVYAEHNYFQLQNRLEEIAKLLGVPSVELLHEQASKGIFGAFKQLLLDVATNNETSFFRDPKVFRAIESQILPEAAGHRFDGQSLRVWSAASSTGQEALSLAMMIHEYNRKNGTHMAFSILGTDVSSRALERAKAASYTQLEVQRGLPAPLLIKYFSKDDQDRWQASAELTRNIVYKQMNLKDYFVFPQKFHLILCRNMLIYQTTLGKMEILKRIRGFLAPGGYLVLGSGESLLGILPDFEQLNLEGAVIYKFGRELARLAA